MNAYLEKQKQIKRCYYEAGERVGIQKMWDFVQIALRDPEIMGNDTFGRKRLAKLYTKAEEISDYYCDAFSDCAGADVMQAHLDDALREVWGDDLCEFPERSPEIEQQSYKHPKRRWIE